MRTYLLSLGKFYLKSYTGLPVACWRGMILNFIQSAIRSSFYFLSIYFIQDLHFDTVTVGSMISCYGLGAIFGGYLGGKLSDFFSPLVVSAVFILCQAGLYFLLPCVHSIYLLIMIILPLGLTSYAAITASHLWILGQCDSAESRMKAINLFSTSSNLGMGIAGLIISMIASFGFHFIFSMTGLCLLFLSMYFFSLIKSETRGHNHIFSVDDENKMAASLSINKSIIYFYILPSVLFIGAIVSQFSSMYPIYIEATFPVVGLKVVSLLFSINTFMIVLLATPIGDYANRFDRLFMMSLGGCFIGAGMFMLALSSTLLFIMMACMIYTIGEIIFFCMAQFLCYQSALPNKKGHGLGLFRIVYASSRMIGPVAGGYIYQINNGLTLWYLSGALGLLCLLGYQSIKISLLSD